MPAIRASEPALRDTRILASGFVNDITRSVLRRRHLCDAAWVRAVGWRGGSADDRSPAGYGIKFTPADRDRHFDLEWHSVVLELADGPTIEVPLTDSFWRSCSELRSVELGRWLLAAGRAPWPKHAPPGIAVNPIADNRFSARILEYRSLL